MKTFRLWIALFLAAYLLAGCFLWKSDSYNLLLEGTDNPYTYHVTTATVTLTDLTGEPLSGVSLKVSTSTEHLLLGDGETPRATEVLLITDEKGQASFLYSSQSAAKQSIVITMPDDPTYQKSFEIDFTPIPWLFLFWIAADNDLQSYALKDIEEIKASLTPSSALIALADMRSKTDRLYLSGENGELLVEELPEEINSGNGAELADFFNSFALGDYERIALILWNHGNAWFDETKSPALQRGVAYDNKSNDFLELSEIHDALMPLLTLTSSGKIDLLGFDACLMGSIEVAYELRELARYMVASAQTIPLDGWDYSFLKDIGFDNNGFEVAGLIISSYAEYYKSKTKYNLSLWELEQLDALYDAIDRLSQKLIETPENIENAKSAKNGTYYFDSYRIGSLYDFLLNLETTATTSISEIEEAKTALLNALPLYATKPATALPGCGIFLPSASWIFDGYSNNYKALEFSANSWIELLENLY